MIKLSECTFRKIERTDLLLILEWRTLPRVRAAMFTNHIISPEEHERWFEKISQDSTSKHFLFHVNGSPVGVFNVTQINTYSGACFWAFYASERAPTGIGVAMEIAALDYMSFELKMRKINCEVLASNDPVLKLHKRFGFQEEGVFKQHIRRGDTFIDVYRLALLTETWPAQREKIVTLLGKDGAKKT